MAAHQINSLISKQARRQLYEYLMQEGTIVVRKDFKLPKHEETGLQNLHVMLMMRSLTSKKYVTEEYNWRYLYYVLTLEGIEYLRQELRLPAGLMPATYAAKTLPRGPRADRPDRPPRRGPPRSYDNQQQQPQMAA